MNKVLEELADTETRTAQFKTVVSLYINNTLETFTGICKGEITKTKHGEKGFGYDPIFKPNNFNETFAEMDLNTKNSIGHRGKAITQLVEFLKSYQANI